MTRRTRRNLLPGVGALIALAAVATIVALPGLRDQFVQSAREITPMAVLVMLPGQLLAFLLCAGALSALRPGVSFRACLASRVLRDAGGNLLVFFPGLGEAIGTRALVLAGVKTRDAIIASTLDVLAEGIAQVPYGLLALLVLPQLVRPSSDQFDLGWGSLPILFLLIVLLGLLVWIGWKLVRRTDSAPARLIFRVRAEAARLRADWATRRRGMAIALLLHLVAWAVGGLQLWAAAQVLGLSLDVLPAIIIESAAYAARAMLFFVPGGLAVQEAALLVACGAFGIGTVPALALALVLRLRDLVFGLPLLGWPLLEYRRYAQSRARE